MLRALFEVDVAPDLVLGTSVGALNGAMVARDPTPAVIDRLTDLWQDAETAASVYATGRCARSRRAVSHRHPPVLLGAAAATAGRGVRRHHLRGPRRSASRCCAASIERAAEHWFSSGRLVDAIMASAAVPGPAAAGRGRTASTTSTAASSTRSRSAGRWRSGADRVFVLQVGRIDRPLTAAAPAVGGGPGLLRDRAPAPVRPRDGRAARRASRRTCCRPAVRRPATTRCWPTATSRTVAARIDASYDGVPRLPGGASRVIVAGPAAVSCSRRR